MWDGKGSAFGMSVVIPAVYARWKRQWDTRSMSRILLVILGLLGHIWYTCDSKVCVKSGVLSVLGRNVLGISHQIGQVRTLGIRTGRNVLGISHQIGQVRILGIVMANLEMNGLTSLTVLENSFISGLRAHTICILKAGDREWTGTVFSCQTS